MSRSTISSIHSLRLIPISKLQRYARIGSKVIMLIIGRPENADAVPGTIKVSTTADNSIYKKKITYEMAEVTADEAQNLEMLKKIRLIATYIDESGNDRVCGSPDYPLSLDYLDEGGVYTITLSGEDTCIDAFMTA
ncbi:MAG: hypothetical protein ACI304_09075 [Lepagella sp.]